MYEINVSRLEKNGMGGPDYYQHLFATSARSIHDEEALKRVYPRIKAAFPYPEYAIEVIQRNSSGRYLSANELATLQKPEPKEKKVSRAMKQREVRYMNKGTCQLCGKHRVLLHPSKLCRNCEKFELSKA